MTVKDVINFYFNQYEKLSINLKMWKGLSGKYHSYTKEDFCKTFEAWMDEEVISVTFQTHYKGEELTKCEIPILDIMFKN